MSSSQSNVGMLSTALLKVVDLCWEVSSRPIVKGLSFTVNANELVGIIGPNGAGKTSLMRCLYGEYRPNAGQIYLDGYPLTEKSRSYRARQMAVVSQNPAIFPGMNVLELVSMGLTPQKGLLQVDTDGDRSRIEQALARVGLSAMTNRNLESLSGGEQQRAWIAKALVQQPRLLILDEPTNHLDAHFQLEIMDLIRELGIATLASIHDINLAARYCDRILLLADGQCAAFDTPERVLTQRNLKQLFGLDCVIDEDPFVGCPRITLASPRNATSAKWTGARQ